MKNKILITAIILSVSIVSAQDVSGLGNFINRLLCFAFMIMPAVVTLLIMVGGILVLTGDSNKRKQGKAVIINAIIGLIILFIVAWLVTLTNAEINFGDFIECFAGGPPPEYPTSTTIPANEPPVAIAKGGFNSTPVPNLTEVYAGTNLLLYFYGGESYDPDGNIVEYHWEFGEGPGEDGIMVNHIYTAGGTYDVQLRVMDDDYAYSMSTVKVIIRPLEAHILKPKDGEEFIWIPGVTVEFDGEGQGGVQYPTAPYYRYQWTSSKDGGLSTNKSFTMDAAQLAYGAHTIHLNVTDYVGAVASDSVTIRMKHPEELKAVILEPTDDRCFQLTLGENITFSGEGEDGVPRPPPEAPYSYRWTHNGVVLSTNKTFTVNVTYFGLGDHTITLEVTDSGDTASDTVIIHIPEPPEAEILIPANDGDLVDCGDKFKGNVSKGVPPYDVTWKADGMVFETGTIAADGGTHEASRRPTAGIHNITFEATDSCDLTASDERNNTNISVCRFDVLIAAIKSNLQSTYSAGQITQLENKIKDYQSALQNDGLSSIFLYLDEDETSDIIGSKVTSPGSWNNVDGILDQLIPKIDARYVLIVGGYRRFPSAKQGGYYTDIPYSDYTGDNMPDVALGRLPDPNNGDLNLFMNSFDTFIGLHNSGGLDLSPHVGRTLAPGYLTMECWSQYIWGQKCSPYPNCGVGTGDSPTAASGKNFFYLTQHGSKGPPQVYASAISPGNLNSMDVSGAVWMIVPCYGGVINYGSTGQSIVLNFFKNGGAIHMGSTDPNCCAVTGSSCSLLIDNCGVGTLYHRIAMNFNGGTRIGDAYKLGKIAFKGSCGTGMRHEFYINCLYGDPTLTIKNMW